MLLQHAKLGVASEFGVQQTHGLVMCCEWTGVLLSTLLDEVAVKPEAKWVLAEGADAAAMTRSVPMAKALDDAIVVYAAEGGAASAGARLSTTSPATRLRGQHEYQMAAPPEAR